MGLVTRVVEASGIPTVLVSTARDLSAQVKPPRTVFLNHPMGNTFGRKGDGEMQRAILTNALEMLHACKTAGTLQHLPYEWHEAFGYKPKKRDPSYQSG